MHGLRSFLLAALLTTTLTQALPVPEMAAPATLAAAPAAAAGKVPDFGSMSDAELDKLLADAGINTGPTPPSFPGAAGSGAPVLPASGLTPSTPATPNLAAPPSPLGAASASPAGAASSPFGMSDMDLFGPSNGPGTPALGTTPTTPPSAPASTHSPFDDFGSLGASPAQDPFASARPASPISAPSPFNPPAPAPTPAAQPPMIMAMTPQGMMMVPNPMAGAGGMPNMPPAGMMPMMMMPPPPPAPPAPAPKEEVKYKWKMQPYNSPVQIKRDTYARPYPNMTGAELDKAERDQGMRVLDILDFLEDQKSTYAYPIYNKRTKKEEYLAPKGGTVIHSTVQTIRYARKNFEDLAPKKSRKARRVQLCTYEGDEVYARFDYGNGFIVKILCDDGADELAVAWPEVLEQFDQKRKEKLNQRSV